MKKKKQQQQQIESLFMKFYVIPLLYLIKQRLIIKQKRAQTIFDKQVKKNTRFQAKKAVLCSEHSFFVSSFDFIIEMGQQKI